MPSFETVPSTALPPSTPSTLQLTPALLAFESIAWNCFCSPGTSDAEAGLMWMRTAAGPRLTAAPPPPPHAARHRHTMSNAARPMTDAPASVGGSMPPPPTTPIDPNQRGADSNRPPAFHDTGLERREIYASAPVAPIALWGKAPRL